jgi:hypothetical protein
VTEPDDDKLDWDKDKFGPMKDYATDEDDEPATVAYDPDEDDE